ncbi:hypothetical protein [Thiomicrorhabdus cannonii]|uniref:hypothetical protein n=1 Tax=Thiomicrorhabdus cannonii TaxID=2748011 RepID=UPI0015B7AB43|nr:hypothetical protein [Thiomicrorhabdus cannonii]
MSYAVTFWFPELLAAGRLQEARANLAELKLPGLRTLLQKADRFPVTGTAQGNDFYHTASMLFHQARALPVAATIARALLKDFDGSCFWLKLDPVQLVPDRDTLVLFPPQDLAITDDEAHALIGAFNQHFAVDGVAIEFASATDWLLRIKQPIDVRSRSIDQVAYHPLTGDTLQGHAAQYWRQLLNEASMLFYNHPVNEARRERGEGEINALWLWGEGQLETAAIQSRPHAEIRSESAYLQGLAMLASSQQRPFPASHAEWMNTRSPDITHSLLLPDALYAALPHMTETQWLETLLWLEQNWFSPLLDDLRAKRIHSLLLELGDGYRYHIKPQHLKRFWRWKNRL